MKGLGKGVYNTDLKIILKLWSYYPYFPGVSLTRVTHDFIIHLLQIKISSVFPHSFGSRSETRQIGKNVLSFLKLGIIFFMILDTESSPCISFTIILQNYCKCLCTYITKYKHLQQFCCKPSNRGSFPFSVNETKAELSTMFYFHLNCSVFMVWNTWTKKLVFSKGNIPAFHVSENTNNHNFVRFSTWSVLIHDCRQALTFSFIRLIQCSQWNFNLGVFSDHFGPSHWH